MPKIVRIQEKKASKQSKIGRSHKKTSGKAKIAKKNKRGAGKPRNAKNIGKSFKYFYDLPAELRMMVVDEMELRDRCRFSQCSFSSSIEAKRSKNYMYSLEFYGLYEDEAKITVRYDDYSNSGFHLHFEVDSGKKCMKYTSFQWKELWRIELPESTDLVHYAAENFKNMLRDYQNIIKKLKMHNYVENELNDFDFGFRNFTNLEVLEMKINSSILPIISNLRKPLKTLEVYGEENIREVENYEISNISERIDLPQLKLNYEQFIQLSAPVVTINIGELTEEDICKIIKSWQNQPTGGKKISYEWISEGSNFDVSKVLRLLGSEKRFNPNAEYEVLMEIKHRFENGKKALLVYSDKALELKACSN